MVENKKVFGYKIRNTKSGLYLKSGSDISESRVGNVWSKRGSALNAISMKIKSLKKRVGFYSRDKNELNNFKENIMNYEIVELVEGDSKPIQFYLGDIDF